MGNLSDQSKPRPVDPAAVARGKRAWQQMFGAPPPKSATTADLGTAPLRITPEWRNQHRARIVPNCHLAGPLPSGIPTAFVDLLKSSVDGKRSFHAVRLAMLLLSEVASLERRRGSVGIQIPLTDLVADLWPAGTRVRNQVPLLELAVFRLQQMQSRGVHNGTPVELPVFKGLRVVAGILEGEMIYPSPDMRRGALIDFDLFRALGGHTWRNAVYLAAAWLADRGQLTFHRSELVRAASVGLNPDPGTGARRLHRLRISQAADWLSAWRDKDDRPAMRLTRVDEIYHVTTLHGRDVGPPLQLPLEEPSAKKRNASAKKRNAS